MTWGDFLPSIRSGERGIHFELCDYFVWIGPLRFSEEFLEDVPRWHRLPWYVRVAKETGAMR